MSAARKTDYTNDAQQRILKLQFVLFGDVVTGLAPSTLAKALNCSQSVITRDLDNLRTAGVAERDEESGMWRLTARLPQQAIKVWASIDKSQRRLDESRARFSRNPD